MGKYEVTTVVAKVHLSIYLSIKDQDLAWAVNQAGGAGWHVPGEVV